MKSRWKWIVIWAAAVLAYLLLDLAEFIGMFRQIIILPICWLASASQLVPPIADMQFAQRLDVDLPGMLATVARASAFAVVLAYTLAPIYLYRRTKNKLYLLWLAFALFLIIASFSFFAFTAWAMTGTMD